MDGRAEEPPKGATETPGAGTSRAVAARPVGLPLQPMGDLFPSMLNNELVCEGKLPVPVPVPDAVRRMFPDWVTAGSVYMTSLRLAAMLKTATVCMCMRMPDVLDHEYGSGVDDLGALGRDAVPATDLLCEALQRVKCDGAGDPFRASRDMVLAVHAYYLRMGAARLRSLARVALRCEFEPPEAGAELIRELATDAERQLAAIGTIASLDELGTATTAELRTDVGIYFRDTRALCGAESLGETWYAQPNLRDPWFRAIREHALADELETMLEAGDRLDAIHRARIAAEAAEAVDDPARPALVQILASDLPSVLDLVCPEPAPELCDTLQSAAI